MVQTEQEQGTDETLGSDGSERGRHHSSCATTCDCYAGGDVAWIADSCW